MPSKPGLGLARQGLFEGRVLGTARGFSTIDKIRQKPIIELMNQTIHISLSSYALLHIMVLRN